MKASFYPAEAHRVKDGDSLVVRIMLFAADDQARNLHVRLLSVDTPETSGRKTGSLEWTAGKLAAAYTQSFLDDHPGPWGLSVKVIGPSKYAPDYLCRIYSANRTRELNRELLEQGLARFYLGATRGPWTDHDLTEMVARHAA